MCQEERALLQGSERTRCMHGLYGQNRRNPLSNNNRRETLYPTKRTPFVEGGLGVSFERRVVC
jgi:hypothetical protein